MIDRSTAILAVSDVTQTVRFYVDVLGFRQNWLWGDPPTFASIGLGKFEVFMNQQPEVARQIEGHQHWFWLNEVDAMHERHVAKGATIISPPQNKPWGVREYTVRDINGYHLRFGGPPKYERPKTATETLPTHIRIEPRLATLQEYESLVDAVGWNKDLTTMAEALKNSRAGVVAIDTRENQTVGMLRVTGDGRAFMIWDVLVRPNHQGQKIGSAMMETSLAELRKIAKPGTFVGLFTSKSDFYQRLGFDRDGGMHRPL